ncbi:MAG: N-acetylmuramoyl-L-alanine amidase family protein [Gemmatimonadaceae bacterium]
MRLPDIPLVQGPLDLRVTYPGDSALIGARDSNFIFGSTGNGDARLSINGAPVPVLPNGSFIAFLPVPPASSPRYVLVATTAADSARLVLPVRLLPSVQFTPTGPLIVDSASVSPREGGILLPPGEPVRVSVRAAANALVWVESGGTRHFLVNEGSFPLDITGADSVPAATVPGRYVGDPERWATALAARLFDGNLSLVVARGPDTTRFQLAAIDTMDMSTARWVLLGGDTTGAASDTDRVVVGRPEPAGTYAWFLLPGTVLETTGRVGGFTRVRLDQTLDIWVGSEEVLPLPIGTAAPVRMISSVTVRPDDGWVDVIFPTGERPAYRVEERSESIVLTLYGTVASPGLMRYLGSDPLVRLIVWEQEMNGRARFTLHLSEAPFGYLAFWDDGRFVLRVRRTPEIDRRPLAGLTITVDAGHPPAGATGPTGLYEGDIVLPVAELVRDMLAERGANVVMTRTTLEPFPLALRPIIARRTGSHALVSIHLNALPDGVSPFAANGTSVLFFQPHSAPLASAIQQELLLAFGLRDLGIHYQNIALGRPTWMPAVLTEGLFIMMPEQEAAMRSAEGREAYARAIVEGLENYFRSLGDDR